MKVGIIGYFLGKEGIIMTEQNNKSKGSALIPFLVFIVVYLGTGIILTIQGVDMAFYQLPLPIAVLCGVVVAFFMTSGPINKRFTIFMNGCGQEDILTMCFIYLFAGGFATVAKAMGGVDATANLGLSVIPAQYIAAGIFVISAFLGISTGTSMGTIGAIGPIAIATADKAGLNLALVLGAVVGGAIFGDNLSVISDTTIAATRTQGVEMRDKFRVNFLIALPAAIVAFVLLLIFGRPDTVIPLESLDFNIIKVIPYIAVLVLALAGLNVFITLGIGTLLAGIIGLATGSFGVIEFTSNIYNGYAGMLDIFIGSLWMGGLSAMVTYNGGINWMLEKIQGFIKTEKSAEIGIAALASVTDCATANNTVAIIVSGPIAKNLCAKFKVDPRKSASLLDIWSCIFQGIMPYAAQVILACSLTNGLVSPVELVPYSWYQLILAVFAIIAIFIPYSDKVIRNRPWDFEKWVPTENK